MSPPPPPRPQRTPENARKKAYKGQVDLNSGRKRRETQLIQIRKSRREDTLSKRRRDDVSTPSTDPEPKPEPGSAIPDSDPSSPSDPPSPATATDADVS